MKEKGDGVARRGIWPDGMREERLMGVWGEWGDERYLKGTTTMEKVKRKP